MANKRIKDLTAQITPVESLLLEVDDAAFTESKSLTVEQINRTTRAGAGLNTDGTFVSHSGSNYIDAATTLQSADTLLDAAIKSNENDIASNASDIAILDEKLSIAKVTLSSANILDLNNPKTLISAPAAGKFIDVISVAARLNFNTTPYVAPEVMEIKVGGLDKIMTIPIGCLQSSANSIFKAIPIDEGKLVDAKELTVYSATKPTTGDSTVSFYITYRVIDL